MGNLSVFPPRLSNLVAVFIVHELEVFVKHLANSFGRGYTIKQKSLKA